jgi:hypothetical protein
MHFGFLRHGSSPSIPIEVTQIHRTLLILNLNCIGSLGRPDKKTPKGSATPTELERMVPEAPRSLLIWYWLAVAAEIYSASNHIWLLVFDDKTIPYALFSTTSLPRAAIYLYFAYKVNPVR